MLDQIFKWAKRKQLFARFGWGFYLLGGFQAVGCFAFQSHQIRNLVWVLHTRGWLAWLVSEFWSSSWTLFCFQTKAST